MTNAVSIDARPLYHRASCAVIGLSSSAVRRMVPVGTAAIDTPFRIASLTKPVTATATVLAAQRAGVELDRPVIEVLPNLRDDWRADERLTITDVLSQTSGLASTVAADAIARLGNSERAIMDAARLVVRAGSARAPGDLWEYYNGNYFLAGAIVTTLTGRTFECALTDLVLRPWGLRTPRSKPRPTSHPAWTGAAYSRRHPMRTGDGLERVS